MLITVSHCAFVSIAVCEVALRLLVTQYHRSGNVNYLMVGGLWFKFDDQHALKVRKVYPDEALEVSISFIVNYR
eukprot:g37.t1